MPAGPLLRELLRMSQKGMGPVRPPKTMKNKVVDIDTAIDQIKKNDTVLFGGFGNVGAPLHLLYALAKRQISTV